MDSTYIAIEREVERRRRQLNALQGLRLGLLLSTGLTAIYGLGILLGLFSALSPWILVGVVGLGAWAGLRWGQTRPIDLQRELYRVDRALGLDEKLTTIYELRRRPGSSSAEILRVLYRQIEGLRLDPGRALPLPPSERRGWMAVGGLAGLSLVLLLLWFLGISPLKIAWDQLLPQFPGEGSSAAFVSPLDERSKEDSSLKDQSATGADEADQSARKTRCRSGSDRSARLTEDGTVDCEDENAVAGQAGASPSAASAAKLAELQALTGALQQLLDQLRRGEISPEQARQSLQDLADQAPSDSLKEALQRVAEALQAEQMQRELTEALQQLQDQIQERTKRQSNSKDGTTGKNEQSLQQNPSSSASQSQGSQGAAGANAEAGQSPSQADAADASNKSDSAAEGPSQGERDGQTQGEGTESENEQAQGQQGEQGANGENAGEAGKEQGQGQGEEPRQGEESAQGSGQANEAQTSGESQGEDASESPQTQSADGESARAKSDAEKRPEGSGEEGASSQQTGGDEPGLESGTNVRDGGSNEGLAASQDLLIRGAPLPQDAQLLDRLLTQGLPVDVAGREPNGRPILRVSLERVEALLELRDLPPELRALVRAYFLALAEEGGGR